jgi:hypothetical protein
VNAKQVALPEATHGSGAIYRLLYISQVALPAEDSAYAAAINEPLKWSQDWNKSQEITGALLFSSGHFAQVLEGPAFAVKALIGNIICDTRHRDLRLLECGLVPARLFGNWSMAYTDGTEQLDLSIMDILGLPNRSQGSALLGMLRHLVMPDHVSLTPSASAYTRFTNTQ